MHELITSWWLFIVVTLFVVTIATVTIFVCQFLAFFVALLRDTWLVELLIELSIELSIE